MGDVTEPVGAVLSTGIATGALEERVDDAVSDDRTNLKAAVKPDMSQFAASGALLDVEIDIQTKPLKRWNSTEAARSCRHPTRSP